MPRRLAHPILELDGPLVGKVWVEIGSSNSQKPTLGIVTWIENSARL